VGGTLTILSVAGYVALLLWGVHMVQSGIVRAYGGALREFLGTTLKYRVNAFLAGLGVTALLQSSTATGLMATSFTAGGLFGLVPALAVMLGANVGTTLIVQVLSFDVTAAAPILILIGLVAFRRGGKTRRRDLGRVAIGLGLILLALHQLVAAIEPEETAPVIRQLFAAITGDPLLEIAMAAVLTWAAHSSVATVLLTMSLAHAGIVTPVSAFALVLGANLGSAVNPVLEGVRGSDPASRRLPIGNLITRAVGCALFLPFLPMIGHALAGLEPDPARQAADLHTAFNLVVAALFIFVLGPYARLLERLLPDKAEGADPSEPRYLDPGSLDTPSVALANAARETLRVADTVETMLRGTLEVFQTGDRKRVAEISRLDSIVDRLHSAIKLYLMKISQEMLDEESSRRYSEILTLDINLEHIGDIIDKNLMELAAKKIKRGLAFSDEGFADIHSMLERLDENLRLALAVFMSGDIASAERLVQQKEVFRDLERKAAENHFARLREGRVQSIETSTLHLDILRDAKRINSHIVAAAYPILERRQQTDATTSSEG
jgi:phosphate:Na+ symporter